LDTREKIVGEERAREIARDTRVRRIAGFFDPLLAEHARRVQQLSEPGCKIIVEVMDRPDALLPQRARAELVAALKSVDFVLMSKVGETAGPICDADMTERFMEHVRARANGVPK